MLEPTTLRDLSGMPTGPASLSDSTLILIDCQNTYTRGVMELDGVAAALDETAKLLERARSAGIPIIHIQHDSGEGTPYDIRAEIGQIVDQVAPQGDEPVVVACATATRALPGPTGVVSSEALQAASLAAIADLFGIVVPDMGAIPD